MPTVSAFAALTTATTAYDALIAEGFTTSGDAHDGSAFVCRITEPGTGVAEPSVSEDPCTTTPPATAYWSFWIANAGQGAWSVSPLGVMSLVPQPGSVEYWNFGSDVNEADQPPLPPSAVRATNTTPTTQPITTPPAGVSPSSGTGGGSGSSATTPTTPGNGKSPRATTSAGGHGAKGAPATSTNSSKVSATTPSTSARGHSSGATPSGRAGSSLKIVDVGPVSAVSSHPSGSPLALVIGGLLVAALALGAVMVVWRRRRLD